MFSCMYFRYNRSEESTDGIDLSASCSFNLRERQAWKLALHGDGLDEDEPDTGPLSVIGNHSNPNRGNDPS